MVSEGGGFSMPNRVIKESIWTSPTVNTEIKKLEHCLALPWWILQADDWGCFDADVDVVKGKVFPKRKDVTPSKVSEMRKAYQDSGLLFVWHESGGREWGYFVSFDAHHNFCNKKGVGEDGKQTKHRRKTPEPPEELLTDYIKRFNSSSGALTDKSRHLPTNGLNPIPNLNPNPNPINTVGKTVCVNGEAVRKNFEEDWRKYKRKTGNKENAFKAYEKTVGLDKDKRSQLMRKITDQNKANPLGKFLIGGEKFFHEWQDLAFDNRPIDDGNKRLPGGLVL